MGRATAPASPSSFAPTAKPVPSEPVTPYAPPALREIAFAIEHQQRPEWCWAAVGTSIGRYFETGSWTQCQVVGATLRAARLLPDGAPSCCDEPAPCKPDKPGHPENQGIAGESRSPCDPCNKDWRLSAALEQVRCSADVEEGGPSLSRLQGEIAERRPVGVELSWHGGGCHFVVLNGVSADGAWISVADPMTGPSLQRTQTFPAHYESGASYYCTLYVRPQ